MGYILKDMDVNEIDGVNRNCISLSALSSLRAAIKERGWEVE